MGFGLYCRRASKRLGLAVQEEEALGDAGTTSGAFEPAAANRITQLGVTHVLAGGGRIPWEEAQLKDTMDSLKANGLTLGNLMIAGFPNTLFGKPGRDEEIEKVIESVRAAGKAGLPVVEYNFYAHRIIEGYYEETGRAGAGNTAFDYERVKDLPPLPQEGVHTLEEMWTNITYFLRAVIPEAEKAGVRMALHPNDPPSPLSRGSDQIMGTIQGWKRLIDIVKSPSNGITFDCGVTKEMGGSLARYRSPAWRSKWTRLSSDRNWRSSNPSPSICPSSVPPFVVGTLLRTIRLLSGCR